MTVARVIPLTQTRAIRGYFDYLIPPEVGGGIEAEAGVGAGAVEVGSIVRVTFAGRTVLAVVAELAADSELAPERLSAISELLPQRLPADLVELALWIAAEYCSTPARALSLLLPPGIGRGLGEQSVLIARLTDAGVSALDDGTRLNENQRAALTALAEAGETVAAELGTPLLRRLEARGLVEIEPAVRARRPRGHRSARALAQAPALTAQQREVLVTIVERLAGQRAGEALGGGRFDGERIGVDRSQPILLHGVTGSGKTEVYLQAAEAALAAGRGVIILVPEIALTPQTLTRFQARLGDVVAVMHSGMSDGARHDEWLRVSRGEARVCVGARSAVFAPMRNIGLIVVDEEHESSYKHDSDPRYDARAVAAQRAQAHGSLLLAGSATPRPEAVLDSQRLRMTERADGRPLPEVEIVDMRGRHHALHPDTRLALADCRRDGGKAIVLLNRRGWSNFLSCGSCGRVWMCPNCEVALVLHRASATISCHHCGHVERVPERCPDCGSVSVSRHGVGTERLEHELATALATPDFPVLRLDADAAGLDARAEILERFHHTPAGVLVGTQMIAKGHDFSDVGLGVVVDADQTLRFPDFRAEERTFALITQLAGRTGRGGHGRVLVQTFSPTARAIRLAAEHDSETFLRGELGQRKALGYPPYSTLIRVICAAPEPTAAQAAATALCARLDPPDTDLLGPAPLFALRGRARMQMLLKTRARTAAIAAVGAAVDRLSVSKTGRGVTISVDVDPQ